MRGRSWLCGSGAADEPSICVAESQAASLLLASDGLVVAEHASIRDPVAGRRLLCSVERRMPVLLRPTAAARDALASASARVPAETRTTVHALDVAGQVPVVVGGGVTWTVV